MSSRSLTSPALKAQAAAYRADLVGIASIDRFEEVPADRHPRVIFPECAAVVVLGRRILRGSLRGIEEGTSFSSTYGMFGYRWLEDNFLAQTTYDLTCWLEARGAEAVPLFGYADSGMPKGRPVAPDRPAPNVILDVQHAATAAGLGEIGLGDFFITPQFGTRQRFALILTDAELEPDPVPAASICSDCGACVEACPLRAIDIEKTRIKGAGQAARPVADVDIEICNSCPNGAMRAPGRGTQPDRIAAACGRACLVRLEAAGKCGNTFENSFRQRAPWALDALHRPVTPEATGNAADIGCGKNLDRIGQQQ